MDELIEVECFICDKQRECQEAIIAVSSDSMVIRIKRPVCSACIEKHSESSDEPT
ncbi:hypothetical protein [Endozoicomonas ascidiicola]|uniref:hypothetical protein n=1 Tax=Endozoicomonas ascidiicola TaxID=1698521 RepID=UPI000A712146|nr:hypothetical protein [Endozoicomonas ascidiicola]